MAAKTSGLPKQPVTSHPSVKSQLDHGTERLTKRKSCGCCSSLSRRLRVLRGASCCLWQACHEVSGQPVVITSYAHYAIIAAVDQVSASVTEAAYETSLWFESKCRLCLRLPNLHENLVSLTGHLDDIIGTTFPFALTLVELLCGKQKRAEVSGPMVFPPNTFA